MVRKKYKNAKLPLAKRFDGGGAMGVTSDCSSLGNQYRAQGLFPEGTNDIANWKPTITNSIDGGKVPSTNRGSTRANGSGGDGGGEFMSKANQIAGFASMFDSIAQSATASIDASRSGTDGQPQVLVEGVLGGQSGSHLGNMWNTRAKTREAINYINGLEDQQYAINNSDNLLAQYSDKRLDNLNINTKGKELEDFIFDPASYLLTKAFGLRDSAAVRQAKINNAINAANARQRVAYDNAVDAFRKNQARNVAANYRAFGGPMYGYMSDGAIAYDMARDNLMVKMMNAQGKNGSQPANTFAIGGLLSDNFTNGVTEIGAGGTHEKNPYAGVPMGLAEDGQPNLVEEGEAIYNDYVFSNRLRVPEAIRSKYRLRGPKDMTYAEAFLNAQKESEERENDPISKNGLDNIAMILAQSQEEVKAKKESRKKAQGGHLFAIGSSLDNPPFDAGSMTPEEFYRINNYWPDGYDPSTGQWMTIGEPSNWTPEKLTSINGTPAPARAASAPVVPKAEPKKVAPAKTATSGTDSYLSDGVNPLRLAPLVGNIGAVLMDTFGATNTPRTFNFVPNFTPIGFSPLGDYVPEFHVDTRYAANQQAQQAAATRGAIMNTTAPNRFAGLLAADYNAQIANGQLLRDAQIADYDNLIKARTFNRATNQNNSEMGLRAAANDARDRLAYAQAKLAEAKANVDETNASWGARGQNVRALTTSFGNLGKELDARDMVKWLTVKGVLGNYSEADLRGMGIDEDTIKEVKGDRYVGTKSHGGKLKKKRGGFTY